MHVSSTRFPHLVFAALLLLVLSPVPARAAQEPATRLFRIFLTDGTNLVSYGEFARVAGRVVFSVPIGEVARDPRLEVVGIPDDAVDWAKTDEYANAVRARQYAATRGEEEFAVLTGHVTVALNDVMAETNPARRLAMAQEARQNLAAWPAANHGYKAEEVARLVALFDDAIAELSAGAAQSSINLSLVAMTLPPPPVALIADPDVRGTFELAYAAAARASDPAERSALLRSLSSDLRYAPASDPWAVSLRRRIESMLADEARTDRAYGGLVTATMKAARERTARADVKGLQDTIARVLRADATLGRKRPGQVAALLATLDAQLNEARRLRLAQDAWLLRRQGLQAYHVAITAPLERLEGFRKWLDSIRTLAGPDPRFLTPLAERARLAHLELMAVTPPAEAQTAHNLLASAFHMTRHAASLRRTAVSSRDMKVAWDASAAAAGALSLADSAITELQKLVSPLSR
jgi:hypothetical protein